MCRLYEERQSGIFDSNLINDYKRYIKTIETLREIYNNIYGNELSSMLKELRS